MSAPAVPESGDRAGESPNRHGGEFINEVVIAHCEQAHITFTRGRPYLKNDQCFVEQKNGAVVRQVVGYDRLEGERAYRQLGEVYQALRRSRERLSAEGVAASHPLRRKKSAPGL